MYTLSYDICQVLKDIVSNEPGGNIGPVPLLNVRLGLEQIQDHVDFRPAAEARWNKPVGERAEPGPDHALLAFQKVSPLNGKITLDQIRTGLGAIIDQPEFVNSCKERWAAWENNPWPRPGDEEPDNVEIDLGAMPDDEHIHPLEA